MLSACRADLTQFNSKFNSTGARQVEIWDKKLGLLSETLDEWLAVQVRPLTDCCLHLRASESVQKKKSVHAASQREETKPLIH